MQRDAVTAGDIGFIVAGSTRDRGVRRIDIERIGSRATIELVGVTCLTTLASSE
jgi:hypothetical protein